MTLVNCLPEINPGLLPPKDGPISVLKREFQDKQIKFICSNIAIKLVQEGFIEPNSLLLMANETSYKTSAEYLASMGANRFLIFTHESPNVACSFYSEMTSLKTLYLHHLFYPAWNSGKLRGFPACFSLTSPPMPSSMRSRKFSALVAANKFFRGVSGVRLLKPKNLIRWLNSKIKDHFNPPENQGFCFLHETRLKVIECFKSDLDLFGEGWDNTRNLPLAWRQRFNCGIPNMGVIPHKREVLNRYRFGFAIENSSAISYITEKIIDCIIAGCVPVYLGCPNVHSFLPSSAFIDMRNFKTLHHLKAHMSAMSDSECEQVVQTGQSWLYSTDAGRLFSYENFALQVTELINQ